MPKYNGPSKQKGHGKFSTSKRTNRIAPDRETARKHKIGCYSGVCERGHKRAIIRTLSNRCVTCEKLGYYE